MTGDDMRTIRAGLGLTRVQFARAIGYRGNDDTCQKSVEEYEKEKREIPPWIATRVRALDVDGLLVFIKGCVEQGLSDQAEFVRRLSLHLVDG